MNCTGTDRKKTNQVWFFFFFFQVFYGLDFFKWKDLWICSGLFVCSPLRYLGCFTTKFENCDGDGCGFGNWECFLWH